MRAEDLAPHMRSHLVRAQRGYRAFVPPTLPPQIEFDQEIVGVLVAAERAVGQLAGVGSTLPSPYLLARAMTRREAVLSSRIEGTQTTLSELVLFEIEPSDRDGTDAREVLNYVGALDHVLAPDRRLPLSLPLLREAHEILLTGVRGGYATPGSFRTTQNWIGSPGCVIDTATYVPPPPEQLWDSLDAFEKYLHAEHSLPMLVTVTCLHYQFEAIHPFIDGNGRVGRLLVTLLLVEWGLLPAPLLDLSAALEPRRDEYYARLLAVSTHGEWREWVVFFLGILAEQAEDAVRRAALLRRLREDYRRRVTTARGSGLLPHLVDALFGTPAMTFNHAASVLGVTHRAAAQNVGKLVEAGILFEVAPHGRTRRFLAGEILDAISGGQSEDSPDAAGRV